MNVMGSNSRLRIPAGAVALLLIFAAPAGPDFGVLNGQAPPPPPFSPRNEILRLSPRLLGSNVDQRALPYIILAARATRDHRLLRETRERRENLFENRYRCSACGAAEAHFRAGLKAEALDIIRAARSIALLDPRFYRAKIALREIGETCAQLGLFDQARRTAKALRRVHQRAGATTRYNRAREQAWTLGAEALLIARPGHTARARKYIRIARTLLGTGEEYDRARMRIVRAMIRVSVLDEDPRLINEGRAIALKINRAYFARPLLYAIAAEYARLNQPARALLAIRDALEARTRVVENPGSPPDLVLPSPARDLSRALTRLRGEHRMKAFDLILRRGNRRMLDLHAILHVAANSGDAKKAAPIHARFEALRASAGERRFIELSVMPALAHHRLGDVKRADALFAVAEKVLLESSLHTRRPYAFHSALRTLVHFRAAAGNVKATRDMLHRLKRTLPKAYRLRSRELLTIQAWAVHLHYQSGAP